MVEKISVTYQNESLPERGSLELLQIEKHLQAADNLYGLIKESTSDPDRAVADLIIDTNTASHATGEDMVIADEVGFGQLLEANQEHENTAAALAHQPSEPLGSALRELEVAQGEVALQTVLGQIDAVQGEHARRDDRSYTVEQSHHEHEAAFRKHAGGMASLGGNEQVELIADRPSVSAAGDHVTNSEAQALALREARDLLGVPAEFSHFQLVDSSEQAQRDDMETMARASRNEFTEGQKMWQERTFGTSEISMLRDDTAERLMSEVEVRRGQEVVDEVSGEIKRPIMDIALDSHAMEQVKRTIEERSTALVRTLAVLNEMAESGVQQSRDECAAQLVEMGAWSRGHGKFLDGDSPAGTIADLYIDATDLAKYSEIDALVGRISGREIDSRARFAEGIINLAAYTFPSGVELMHATHADSLNHIVEHGAVAPRSQVLHGVHRETQLNGGFVHMTAPGSVAYEYAKGAQKVVFGVPVDVIMDHSPYIQLEHAYMDNFIRRTNEETGTVVHHSMQYELGKLQINDIATAPMVFQAALQTMHTNLDKGLRHTYLKNGLYNNYSFAAGDRADTAGAYTYPLEKISIYTNSFEPIKKAVERYPSKQATMYDVSHVAVASRDHQLMDFNGNTSNGSGRLLSEIALPNFDINNEAGVTIYAPVSSREVAFTEGDVGNSHYESNLSVSLDTIKPGKVAKFSGDLLVAGVAPDVVFGESIKSINEQGGRAQDFITAFNRNRTAFEAAGISIEKIIQRLSPEKLEEINLYSYDPRAEEASHRYMNQEDYTALTKVYGDRLYLLNPDDFANEVHILEASGYPLNEQQRAYVDAYQEREREREEQPLQLPDYDLHF
jgi:hypothetical protein